MELAQRYGLQGRVSAAHGNSLAYQPVESVSDVLRAMSETEIHLGCLPYGFVDERIKRPKAAGVAVSLINDNLRDPWQRGGRADLLLFEAASVRDVILHQIGPAMVLKAGRLVAEGGRPLW